MKLNKYLLGLAVVVMGTFSACNTDVEGEYYRSDFNNVSFDVASASVSVANDVSSTTVPVRIIRANTANAYTAHYTASASADGIFTDDKNGTVEFAPGQEAAIINVSANNLEKEVGYTYTMTLSDADIATADTITNTQKKEITVSVLREGDWNSIGKCMYRDNVIAGFFTAAVTEYPVEVLESAFNPGLYRLKNPYGEIYPYNEEGDWDASKNYYVEIDATDPNFVWVKPSELGVDWGYGMMSISSMVAYYMENGYTLDELKSTQPQFFGSVVNGVLTMPAKSILFSMADYNDGGLYQVNADGMFRLLLPGAVVTDYSAALYYTGVFTNKDNDTFAVGELELGPDAANATVLGVVVDGAADEGAVADALAAGDIEGTEVEAGTIYLPLPEDLSGALRMVIAIINDGKVENVTSTSFEYFGGGENPWKTLGTGYYTEDFILNNPYTFEVTIEESKETPGLYRLKKPYKVIADGVDGVEGEGEDLVIHAENPKGVYFTTQSIGISDSDGLMSILSYGGDYIEYYTSKGYSEAQIIDAFPDFFGSVTDGVITLPAVTATDQEGNPRTYEDGSPILFEGYMIQGSSTYYAGLKCSFKVVLPSAAASVKAKAKAQAMTCSMSDFKFRAKALNTGMKRGKMMHNRMVKTIKNNLKPFKK